MKEYKTPVEIIKDIKEDEEYQNKIKALFGEVVETVTTLEFTDEDKCTACDICVTAEDETKRTLDIISFSHNFVELIKYLNQYKKEKDIIPTLYYTNTEIKDPTHEYAIKCDIKHRKLVKTIMEIDETAYELLVSIRKNDMLIEVTPTECCEFKRAKYFIEAEITHFSDQTDETEIHLNTQINSLTIEDKMQYNQIAKQINTFFNKREKLFKTSQNNEDVVRMIEDLRQCLDKKFINDLFRHNIERSLNTETEVYLTIQHSMGTTIPRIKYVFTGNNFDNYIQTYSNFNDKLKDIDLEMEILYIDKSEMLRGEPKIIEHKVKDVRYSRYSDFFENYFMGCIDYDGEKSYASKRIEICLTKGNIVDIVVKHSYNRTYFVNDKREIVAECKTSDLKVDAELLKAAINQLLMKINK